MKKLTTIKLFIALLFIIPILFTQCSKKLTSEEGTVFKASMPMYQILDAQHPVDSIRRLVANNTAMEVVYFSDGRIVPCYDHMNIRNLTLRGLYSEHQALYGVLATRLNKYYKSNDVNYILFNAYLVSQSLPALTKVEYDTNISARGKPLRAPPGESFAVASLNTAMKVLIFVLVLLLIAKLLDTKLNLSTHMSWKKKRKPVDDS